MSSLTYVDDSLVPLNDVLDLTGYTIKYILEKLYQNNPKFVQKLNGDRVIKVEFKFKTITL
jgi:predicted nucleotidyltransferase